MKILLVANFTNTSAYDAMLSAERWLASRKHQVLCLTSEKLLRNSPVREDVVAQIASFGLAVTFGGDGTILRTASAIGASGVPLLGINHGTLGFLAGATNSNPQAAIEAAIALVEMSASDDPATPAARIEARALLHAEVCYSSGRKSCLYALNEVVAGRSDQGRDITLGLAVNSSALPDLRGDGAIVATASGSSAYALSAGSPLISPVHQGLCLVPLMPRPPFTHPILTAPGDIIQISARQRFNQGIVLWADGQRIDAAGEAVLSITARSDGNYIKLISYDAPEFYTRAAQAFLGGAPC
jgi:NAD+ kinase